MSSEQWGTLEALLQGCLANLHAPLGRRAAGILLQVLPVHQLLLPLSLARSGLPPLSGFGAEVQQKRWPSLEMRDLIVAVTGLIFSLAVVVLW